MIRINPKDGLEETKETKKLKEKKGEKKGEPTESYFDLKFRVNFDLNSREIITKAEGGDPVGSLQIKHMRGKEVIATAAAVLQYIAGVVADGEKSPKEVERSFKMKVVALLLESFNP